MEDRFRPIRTALFALASVPLVGACSGVSSEDVTGRQGESAQALEGATAQAPACEGTGAFASNDPRAICKAVCTSATKASDLRVEIDQTAEASGEFIAKVRQSHPQRAHFTFHHVAASWSGDFFNFNDKTTLPRWERTHLKLHTLVAAGKAPSDANAELYTDDNTLGGGPVNVSSLDCTVSTN